MKLRPMMYAVAGALALSALAGAAHAGSPDGAPSRITLEDAVAISTAPLALGLAGDYGGRSVSTETAYRSVYWHPRHSYHPPEHDNWSEPSKDKPTGSSQVHMGFYDPDGDAGTSFLAGARGGMGPDQHLQFGIGVDWAHKSQETSELISSTPLPGGGSSERRLELAHSSTNLVPMQAYAQFMPGDLRSLMPYFGVSGGYEAMFISAEDFQTGDKFDATYGGWGWQAFAGLSIPVTGKSRLNAEVFRNQCTVKRDVTDPQSGITYREEIPLDGIGMRFGVGWGF